MNALENDAIQQIKAQVNTLATLSLKAERYELAVKIKHALNDLVATPANAPSVGVAKGSGIDDRSAKVRTAGGGGAIGFCEYDGVKGFTASGFGASSGGGIMTGNPGASPSGGPIRVQGMYWQGKAIPGDGYLYNECRFDQCTFDGAVSMTNCTINGTRDGGAS